MEEVMVGRKKGRDAAEDYLLMMVVCCWLAESL
jgi:hypothetical protein